MGVLDDLKFETEDETIGVKIVRKALEMPMRRSPRMLAKTAPSLLRTYAPNRNPRRASTSVYDVVRDEYIDISRAPW
jgi:chaperonin GroEL